MRSTVTIFGALMVAASLTNKSWAAPSAEEIREQERTTFALQACAYPIAMDHARFKLPLADLKKTVETVCEQQLKASSAYHDPNVISYEKNLGMCGDKKCVSLDGPPDAILDYGRIYLHRAYEQYIKVIRPSAR